MELLIGFVLGIIGGVVSSFVFIWLTGSRQRPLLSMLRNPLLKLRSRRGSPERAIADVIQGLFRAWATKDRTLYLSFWSDDCVRIQGATSNSTQDKAAIAAKFDASCARYSAITVPTLVIEDIRVAPDGSTATAYVYYRFDLSRATDRLPTIEHSREVYSFRRTADTWQIAANLDHFSEISPSDFGTQ